MSCSSDRAHNRDVIARFEQQIKHSNGSITCFYDVWFKDYGAVLEVKQPGNDVFYAVLIPAISLVLSINVCLLFCKWCRKKEKLNVPVAKPGATSSEDSRCPDIREQSIPLKHSKEQYKRAKTV